MIQAKIVDVLNRALATQYRSLPMFVEEISPYTHSGDEKPRRLLADIVSDQKQYAKKLAEFILDRGGAPNPGQYPMVYTDLHMLSLDYLLSEIDGEQRRDIAILTDCVAGAARDPAAQRLLEEVLGNARGHAESIEGLLAQIAR